MTHIEAMKQALEYLLDNQHYIADNERHVYVMEYNAFIEKLEQAIATEESSATQEHVAMQDFNIFSEDGENWYEHPADAQLIYDALGDDAKVGDTFDVWAGWSSVRVAYQIISVSEDGECEVKQINPQPKAEQEPKRERILFPSLLRQMWSGGDVQRWLDENVNGIKGEV